MAEKNLREKVIDSYHSVIYRDYLEQSPALWTWALRRIERNFREELETLPRDGRILDLPCGVGYAEHVLLGMGFENVEAVDASSEQVEDAIVRLKESYGEATAVRFYVSDALEYLEINTGYSAIFMIDFVEHLSKEAVHQIFVATRRALNPGGLLFLRTPNAESPMFGRFYNDLSHETPFTRSSMKQCLRLSGLDPQRVGFERENYVGDRPGFLKRSKRLAHRLGLAGLGRLLGVPAGGFSENIVCVARKFGD